MFDTQSITAHRDRVGESPVWSVAEQALYWVDIEGQRLNRLEWATRLQSSWKLPEQVGCIALSSRKTVIAAMETGIFEVELHAYADIKLTRLDTIVHPQSNMRFNDGRCDAKGRLWVSTMVRNTQLGQAVGGIYCLDANGLQGPVQEGFITPNGMAFSNDGQTAYLSDSHASKQMIWRHSFNKDTGTWGTPAEWVDMKKFPGRPDGAAMDTENCYWICGNDAGLVHRFSPIGQLLQSIPLPVSKPAMCAFGGPDLRHMFVTSIQPAAPVVGFDSALDGAVFVCDPGVQGVPEPLFSQFPVS